MRPARSAAVAVVIGALLATAFAGPASAAPTSEVVLSGTPTVAVPISASLQPDGGGNTSWFTSSSAAGDVDEVEVANATESYIPAAADAGRYLYAEVTVIGVGGFPPTLTFSVYRSPVVVVQPGSIGTVSCTVSGTARVGETLTGTAAPVATPGATAAWSWSTGSAAATTALSGADAGLPATATVTITAPGYAASSATCASSAVALGTLTVSKPTIAGTVKVRKKLRATAEATGGEATFAYRWYAGAKPIARATKATLQLKRALEGKKISVRVTASALGYTTAQATSAKTKRVR